MTISMPVPANINRKYYCCYGRLHVTRALLAITCVLVLTESLEMIMYITGRYALKAATHYFFDIFETVSIAGLIAALRTEQPVFLWPFLITQFLILISVLLLTIISYAVILFPTSDYWSLFVTPEEESGPKINVRLKALLAWIVYFITDIYQFWIISVALACHRYYDDKLEKREERLRRNRNRNPAAILKRQVPEPQPTTELPDVESANREQSFSNPAFFIETSEDEGTSPPFQERNSNRQIV